jgi:hypothetical protein
MEKAQQDKQPEMDEQYSIKSLKVQTILSVFETLDLEERRDMIPVLLKKAKIINKHTIDKTSSDFVRWICSGERKEWKQEEVERAWEMWNLLYRRASGGILFGYGGVQYAVIFNHYHSWNEDYDNDHERDKFYDDREKGRVWNNNQGVAIELSRELFFKKILEQFTQDNLKINLGTNDDTFEDSDFIWFIYDELSFADFEKTLENPVTGGYESDIVSDPRLTEVKTD